MISSINRVVSVTLVSLAITNVVRADDEPETFVTHIGIQDNDKIQGLVEEGRTVGQSLDHLLLEKQAAGTQVLVRFQILNSNYKF